MSGFMKETFRAKSIEDAKELASQSFGVSVDQIVFRILEEPKKGVLGIGKKDAVVEASYEPIVAEPQTAPVSNGKKKPEKIAEVLEEMMAVPEEAPEEEKPAQPKVMESMENEAVKEILTEETMTSGVKAAKQYIIDIYHEMGVEVEITVMRTENGIRMEVDNAGKSGTIIGRRGETLDSIQYLVSILINRDNEDYCRLLLDSNGYREKRRKTLEQLAQKIAKSVLKTGRSNTLEPMNPYERRIIHSQISGIEGVSSRSVGEDPYRKVVISCDRSRRGGNGRGRGQKRNYPERKPEDFKRKNLDSMKTSFERDYKKPKPEDELNAGLYGKIEF